MRRLFTSARFIRYLVAGIAAFLVDYLALLALLGAGAPLWAAVTIGFCGGLAVNFLLNQRWTFRAPTDQSAAQGAKYLALVAFNLVFTYAAVAGAAAAGIGPAYSKPLVTALIVLWNYALYRAAIFRLA